MGKQIQARTQAEEIRALTAELHGAIKDGRALLRELRESMAAVDEYIIRNADSFNANMNMAINAVIDPKTQEISNHVNKALCEVKEVFDQRMEEVLTEFDKAAGPGGLANVLHELSEMLHERVEERMNAMYKDMLAEVRRITGRTTKARRN